MLWLRHVEAQPTRAQPACEGGAELDPLADTVLSNPALVADAGLCIAAAAAVATDFRGGCAAGGWPSGRWIGC